VSKSDSYRDGYAAAFIKEASKEPSSLYHGSRSPDIKKLTRGAYVTPYSRDATTFGVPWSSDEIVQSNSKRSSVGRPPSKLKFKGTPPKDHPIYLYRTKNPKSSKALTNTGKRYDWNRTLDEDAEVEMVKVIPSWHKEHGVKTASVEYRGTTFPGYNQPTASNKKGKKKMVLVKKDGKVKLVHFGAVGYKHNYSKSAKKNYLTRSAGIKNKSGQLTKDDPFSPNHWSRKVLWPSEEKADGTAKDKTASDTGDYARHSALNFGQAARDVRWLLEHPGADKVAPEGSLKHKASSLSLRLPSLASNVYYGVLPPLLHHTREELADSKDKSLRTMLREGYNPWGDEKTASVQKTAVIIKGNSKHIDKNTAHLSRPFYAKLKGILESEGYKVSFDPGLSFTKPKDADVWVGFSRGVGRLRFAPEGTIAIAIGSSIPNAINHPADAKWQQKYKHLDMRNIPENERPPIPKEHLMITSSMESELRRRVRVRTEKNASSTRHQLITGVPGSGKSTLAKRIAKERGLPLFEIDSDPRFKKALRLVDEGKMKESNDLQRQMFRDAVTRKEPHVIEGAQIMLDPKLARQHELQILDASADVLAPRWSKREAGKHRDRAISSGRSPSKDEGYYDKLYRKTVYPRYKKQLDALTN